ncbi:ATP-binding protein [Candidatus Neomarinimicrobiota bacterium]
MTTNGPIKVLLVEDNPGDARLIREMLIEAGASRIELACAVRLDEAFNRLSNEAFDVMLLDLNLPDSHGFDTFLQAYEQAPEVPIIMLTGLDDEALGVRAVHAGAQDYLVKGNVDSSSLVRTIRYTRERQRILAELKQTSHDLEVSRASFHSIVEKSADGILVVDLHGVVRFINATAISQFKRKKRDVVGELFGRPIVAGEVTEVEIIRPDEANGLAEMRAVETMWDGEPAHLAMFRDITDRKRAEERLLRQEKLAAMGKLGSILGHEIRGPLGVIKNSAEFLEIRIGKHLDEKVTKHMSILKEETDIIDNLIDDILGFARTKEPDFIAVDPNHLVDKAVDHLIVPANVEIVRKYGSGLLNVTVDTLQIQRAFSNIMMNAFEAMNKGGTLTITTQEQTSENLEGGFIAFSFQDTGEGISQQHMTDIFEPLFTTKSKGTGLGLAACQNIVHAHGGRIEVESIVGKKTIFTVNLPLGRQLISEASSD